MVTVGVITGRSKSLDADVGGVKSRGVHSRQNRRFPSQFRFWFNTLWLRVWDFEMKSILTLVPQTWNRFRFWRTLKKKCVCRCSLALTSAHSTLIMTCSLCATTPPTCLSLSPSPNTAQRTQNPKIILIITLNRSWGYHSRCAAKR